MRSNGRIWKRSGWTILLVVIACICFDACSHKKDTTITAVSFNKDIVPILTANCATSGCHTGQFPQSNLRLDSAVAYTQLSNKGYFIAGQPQNSIMYLQMTGNGNTMPPTGILTTDITDKVKNWIAQGALDN